MLTYPWKCTVLHCNHLGNTWKPLVLMTRHFDYCPSASEGDNQSVRSSAPVVSRCFPGGYNVKLYISRGRLAWWLLAFLHSDTFRRREWARHAVCRSEITCLFSIACLSDDPDVLAFGCGFPSWLVVSSLAKDGGLAGCSGGGSRRWSTTVTQERWRQEVDTQYHHDM